MTIIIQNEYNIKNIEWIIHLKKNSRKSSKIHASITRISPLEEASIIVQIQMENISKMFVIDD